MGVWRSANQIYRYTYLLRSDISVFFMDDFEQFDAFQRCREFVRAVAEPLNRGAFSKDPVLVTQLRKTMLSIYSNFAEGFSRKVLNAMAIGNLRNSSQSPRARLVRLEANCSIPLILVTWTRKGLTN